MSETVRLSQMLEARERRAERQRALLARYALPLVSYSMNIAGPTKNGPLIRRGFRLGRRMLLERLELAGARVVHAEETDAVTGCEGLYAVEMPAQALKALTGALEDGVPLGRLWDMDVLSPDGAKLERAEPRRCLICGQPARACARSRAHTVEQLQEATAALLTGALDAHDARTAAALATRALLYEVCVTPKPGLVDRANSGSHRDMDIYSFMASSASLWPYFEQCVRVGRDTAALEAPRTLEALRQPGMRAECDMRRATGGANTHKGAIYSMGLVCGALGRLDAASWAQPQRVLAEVAAMAAGSVARELGGGAGDTAGQRIYARYGVAGVRGEAEAGFPSVLGRGLPALEEGLVLGKSPDEAGAAALLAVLTATADTNLIARGGPEGQARAVERARALLEGSPWPDAAALEALDRAFIAENLSPGGSADLLALCWMLHFLKEEADL